MKVMIAQGLTFSSIDNSDVFQLINTTRKGVEISEFNEFAGNFPLNASDWSRILNLSQRSIQRYKRENKRLDPIHTEKLLLIMLLFKKGIEIFGNTDNFIVWMNAKNIAIGGIQPINLLDNLFGINMIKDELIKIEQGILA